MGKTATVGADPYITVSAAARMVGLAPTHIETLAEVGDLASAKHGELLVVSLADVLELAVRS